VHRLCCCDVSAHRVVGLCVMCSDADVLVVILSDVMFFLSESNQKYTFFAQDNKVCVLAIG